MIIILCYLEMETVIENLETLPYFLQLLTKNAFLYAFLTSGTIPSELPENVKHSWYTNHSVELYDFPLNQNEILDKVFIGGQGPDSYITFEIQLNDDRYYSNSAKYFGKDTYKQRRVFSLDGSVWTYKTFWFESFEVPIYVDVNKIGKNQYSIEVKPLSNFKNYDISQPAYSLEYILAIYTQVPPMYTSVLEKNDLKGMYGAMRLLMKGFDKLKEHNDLASLKPLLSHEDLGVRVFATSHYLLVDEKLALKKLKKLLKNPGPYKEQIEQTIEGWKKQELDFIY